MAWNAGESSIPRALRPALPPAVAAAPHIWPGLPLGSCIHSTAGIMSVGKQRVRHVYMPRGLHCSCLQLVTDQRLAGHSSASQFAAGCWLCPPAICDQLLQHLIEPGHAAGAQHLQQQSGVHKRCCQRAPGLAVEVPGAMWLVMMTCTAWLVCMALTACATARGVQHNL